MVFRAGDRKISINFISTGLNLFYFTTILTYISAAAVFFDIQHLWDFIFLGSYKKINILHCHIHTWEKIQCLPIFHCTWPISSVSFLPIDLFILSVNAQTKRVPWVWWPQPTFLTSENLCIFIHIIKNLYDKLHLQSQPTQKIFTGTTTKPLQLDFLSYCKIIYTSLPILV